MSSSPACTLPCLAMVTILAFLVIFTAGLSAREAFSKVHEDDAANVVHEDHPVPVPVQGYPCKLHNDSASGLDCNSGLCAERQATIEQPGCQIDGILTPYTSETGPDCGGSCAAPHLNPTTGKQDRRRCGKGVGCVIDDDCNSKNCQGSKCV